MNPVSDQIEVSEDVDGARFIVTVSPIQELFHDKEKHDTCYDGVERGLTSLFERLR